MEAYQATLSGCWWCGRGRRRRTAEYNPSNLMFFCLFFGMLVAKTMHHIENNNAACCNINDVFEDQLSCSFWTTAETAQERWPRFTLTSHALGALQCIYLFIYLYAMCADWLRRLSAGLHLITMKIHFLGCQKYVFGCQCEKFSHSCHKQIIQNIWFASPTGTRGDLVILSKKMWGEVEKSDGER